MLDRRSLDEPRRAALAILVEDTPDAERAWAFEWLRSQPPERTLEAFAMDLVDQLVLRRAEEQDLVTRLPEPLAARLKERRRSTAGRVLLDQQVLGEASGLLDELGVEYVALKGVLLRHILYPDPYLRPAVDIDLLVRSSAAHRALHGFQERGYEVIGRPHNDTHEVSVIRRGVGIDLHWQLLRPGRMRVDLAAEMLDRRVHEAGIWGPSELHQTVMMLVHPAITEHVTGYLVHAADLDLWLRKRQVPWDEVTALLGRMGLKTAAWAMLYYSRCLFGTPVGCEVMQALAPGRIRQQYLERWIAHHPFRHYARHPWLVRAGFSLALQDEPSDAARALVRIVRKVRMDLDQP